MTDLKVILIGPIGAGKSTLSRLVAKKLGIDCRHMDDIRIKYYSEIGYSEEKAKEISDAKEFLGLYRYWKPFEAHAVERLIGEKGSAVLDFGGGHSVYESDLLFARVERAFAPQPHVFLLLPSPDKTESVATLRERRGEIVSGEIDFHEHFVRHRSNYALAKHIIYTNGKSPDESSAEIVDLVLEESMP